jgi:hypothetical protein
MELNALAEAVTIQCARRFPKFHSYQFSYLTLLLVGHIGISVEAQQNGGGCFPPRPPIVDKSLNNRAIVRSRHCWDKAQCANHSRAGDILSPFGYFPALAGPWACGPVDQWTTAVA